MASLDAPIPATCSMSPRTAEKEAKACQTPVAILREARDLISDPARWTRHELARDKDGNAVHPTSEEATCWCAQGALAKVHGRENYLSSRSYALLSSHASPQWRFRAEPSYVNDCNGHQATLAMYDRAIAAAEQGDLAW